MPIYSMALATAADNSLRHEFVAVGTSVLLLNAAGGMFAPLLMGQLMALYGPGGLFWGCAAICAVATGFFVALLRRKPRVDDVMPFTVAATDMAPTSFDLDPRAPEEMSDDLAVAEELPAIVEAPTDEVGP